MVCGRVCTGVCALEYIAPIVRIGGGCGVRMMQKLVMVGMDMAGSAKAGGVGHKDSSLGFGHGIDSVGFAMCFCFRPVRPCTCGQR